MLKTVSILTKMDSEVSDENDFYDNFNEFYEYYENNEEKETCLDNNLLEELNQYSDSLAKELELYSNEFPHEASSSILTSIRCAAYTLQLAVDNALKDKSIAELIAKARKVCKKLRTLTVLTIIKRMKFFKPILDCVTRCTAHMTCWKDF